MSDDDLDALFDQIDEDYLEKSLLEEPNLVQKGEKDEKISRNVSQQEESNPVAKHESKDKSSLNVSQNEELLRQELEEMKRKMKMMEEMLQKQQSVQNDVNEPRSINKQPDNMVNKPDNDITNSLSQASRSSDIKYVSQNRGSTKTSTSESGCKKVSPAKSSLSDMFTTTSSSQVSSDVKKANLGKTCPSDCKKVLPPKSSLSDMFNVSLPPQPNKNQVESMSSPAKPCLSQSFVSSIKDSSSISSSLSSKPIKKFGAKSVTDPVAAAKATKADNMDKCPHSGLRIVNRVIAKNDFNCAVATRKFIKISQLPLHFKDKKDVTGDWLTSGVIVRKKGPLKSSNGNDYSIWTLSDLVSPDNIISVFLFKDVHLEHRKEQVGTVVSILNPSFMPPKDQEKGKKSDMAFSADNSKKILRMGMSGDYATCRHTSKSGQTCNNFINKALTQYCDFHVVKVHAKMRNKRMVLSGAFTPSPNESKVQKLRNDCQAFTHKGSVYYPNVSQKEAGKESGDPANLVALKKKGVVVSTPLIGTKEFESMLKMQSAGSMQLKRSLDETCKKATEDSTHKSKRAKLESVGTFTTFFKKNVESPILGTGMAGGDVIDLNIPTRKTTAKAKALALAKKGAFTPKTKRKRHEMTATEKSKMMERSLGIEKVEPAKEEILNGPSDLLYYKPIDTRKKSSSVFENKENKSSQKAEDSNKKKGILSAAFGSIDANSAEGKQIMKAQSINAGAVKDQEIERTTEYFNAMEKFENNEEKLLNIKEMKVTVYLCSICNTATTKQLPLCVEKGHPTKKGPSIRRFFRCRGCSLKTNVVGLPFPDHCCSKCGKTAWVKCSMYNEIKGPKLESEKLVVRVEDVGNQDKFK